MDLNGIWTADPWIHIHLLYHLSYQSLTNSQILQQNPTYKYDYSFFIQICIKMVKFGSCQPSALNLSKYSYPHLHHP